MAENPSRFLYITRKNFLDLLETLNIDTSEKGGLGDDQQRDLLDRAAGDLESDLVERFKVPLKSSNGADFSAAPIYSRQKVLNAMKSKLRQIIGGDKQKNLVIDSTERYIDIKKSEYKDHIKDLVNHKRDYGLQLQSFASDTAVQPVQFIGTARPNNKRQEVNFDEEEFIF